jgi:hypothetical protein
MLSKYLAVTFAPHLAPWPYGDVLFQHELGPEAHTSSSSFRPNGHFQSHRGLLTDSDPEF